VTAPPIRVLFVCTGNAARSQMAEALLRQLGGGAFEVFSAGTNPRRISPNTVRVLDEAGIDATGARSKSVREFIGGSFDYVVTVCDDARESCPRIPGARTTLHWSIPDPSLAEAAGQDALGVFRRTLADIRARVKELIPLAVADRDARVVGQPNRPEA
jgi:protein-tyrosine-phosphatase